ncbi:hypothetical protein LCGC14_0147030 [marine sediment metagenome]|uniref:Helix-turn-helix domain-containing protein n=1 Tax=marine sediment metagenome TaxID=412755 RepID=A0A0F9XHM1_9ZZZZ
MSKPRHPRVGIYNSLQAKMVELTENTNPGFFQVYIGEHGFVQNHLKVLKGAKLSVYLALCEHMNIKGEAFPSNKYLSELTGYSLKSIIRAKKQLDDSGFIRRRIIRGRTICSLNHDIEVYDKSSLGTKVPIGGDKSSNKQEASRDKSSYTIGQNFLYNYKNTLSKVTEERWFFSEEFTLVYEIITRMMEGDADYSGKFMESVSWVLKHPKLLSRISHTPIEERHLNTVEERVVLSVHKFLLLFHSLHHLDSKTGSGLPVVDRLGVNTLIYILITLSEVQETFVCKFSEVTVEFCKWLWDEKLPRIQTSNLGIMKSLVDEFKRYGADKYLE